MSSQEKPSILVADDSPEILRRIVALLQERSVFDIQTARNGNDALLRLEESIPACAILDYSMPGFTGLDVLRQIRQSGQNCFVVILTGSHEQAVRDECLRAGVDRFFNKSEDIEDVVDVVHQVWSAASSPQRSKDSSDDF